MTSLGRSIGRRGLIVLSHRTYPSIIYSADGYSSSISSPFLHFSRCIHAVGEGKGESPLWMISPRNVLKETGKKVIRLLEKYVVKEPRGLEVGDAVDLRDLLFTNVRDYLIKCNSGQQVKGEQLAGKMVVLYFDSIFGLDDDHFKCLMHMYTDLQSDNNFEVIFVDTNLLDADLVFSYQKQNGKPVTNKFPTLPWIAIPLSDLRSRIHLKQTFGIGNRERDRGLIVINPDGTILHMKALGIFTRYGADGYPFTKERIDELESEDKEDVKKPSLNALLTSSKRYHLVSNKGEEVPIDNLKDKVVALFFYAECPSHRDFTEKLKVAYEELRMKNEAFEVVLIYIYDSLCTSRKTSEETFSETFKTMPWLGLPFGDSKYYKLQRLFFLSWDVDHMEDHGLIVIGPHMKFIQPFGLPILRKFKSPAYPFSCERVAELVAEKAKELELKMLWHPDGVFGGKYRSEEVKLDQFVEKNVIVLYDAYGISRQGTDVIIEKLIERYESMGRNDEFKVIHITSPGYEYDMKLPWDVVQLDRDYTVEPNLFGLPGTFTRIPSLIAFDGSGRVVRKTMFPTFDEIEFPFYSGGLEEEALSQLTCVFEWDWVQEAFPPSIYTYKKNVIVYNRCK